MKSIRMLVLLAGALLIFPGCGDSGARKAIESEDDIAAYQEMLENSGGEGGDEATRE